jgi:hypothetical protein
LSVYAGTAVAAAILFLVGASVYAFLHGPDVTSPPTIEIPAPTSPLEISPPIRLPDGQELVQVRELSLTAEEAQIILDVIRPPRANNVVVASTDQSRAVSEFEKARDALRLAKESLDAAIREFKEPEQAQGDFARAQAAMATAEARLREVGASKPKYLGDLPPGYIVPMLPVAIVAKVPRLRNYRYDVASDGRVFIVSPVTYRISAIIAPT